MKKLALGLFLALAGLGFLVSPVMAAASPPQPAPSASLQAFLASIAAPATPVAVGRRPPPVGRVGTKSLCSATANCASGTVYCEDNTNPANCTGADRNCDVGEQGHVTCDGVTTWCPYTECPGCPQDWCTYEQECAWSCYPCDYTYTCNETYCTDHCHCKFSTCPP